MQEELDKYKNYLKTLESVTEQCFQQQKNFIRCKVGCSYCCEEGDYPTSKLEYEYIKIRLNMLDKETKLLIKEKVQKLYKQRTIFIQKRKPMLDFIYICPLLHENTCLVYEYRPIICRIHGLLIKQKTKDGINIQIPGCVERGLNYSDVWDEEQKKITPEKITESKSEIKPEAYDLFYQDLLKEQTDIDFGDVKMLFERIFLDNSLK